MKKFSVISFVLAVAFVACFAFSHEAKAGQTNMLGTINQVGSFTWGSAINFTATSNSGQCAFFVPNEKENQILAVSMTALSAGKSVYIQTDDTFTCSNNFGNLYGILIVN